MVAAMALARAALRSTWRQLLLFALVVGVGAFLVMVTIAGARRADTSFSRFREATHDGNLFVGVEEAPERLTEVQDLATVEVFAPVGYVPIHPPGASDQARDEGGGFASLDGRWLYDVQRPRVLAGRMPPADASRSVAVNEEFAREHDVSPGAVIPLDALSFDTGAVSRVELEVKAVVRSPMDIGVNAGGPLVYLPPGVLQAHPEIQALPGYGVVMLVHGDADVPRFQAAAAALFEDEPSYRASVLADEARTVERAIDVQVTVLLAVAAMAGLAAIALIIQLTARQVQGGLTAQEALRSLGASRGQLLVAAALPLVTAASVAVIAAAPAAALLSWKLPRGLARITEPDPGVRVDAIVIVATSVTAVLLVAAIALLLAGRGAPAGRRSGDHAPLARERATVLFQRPGGSVPLLTGLRLARPPGRGGERRTGVAAYAGMVVGFAGLLAVSAISVELDRVAADEGAWGAPFDLVVGGRVEDAAQDGAKVAAEVPGVAAVTAVRFTEVIDLGRTDAAGLGVDAVEGELLLTMVEGRSPTGADEVVLGPRVAAELGVGVGDLLEVPVAGGQPTEHRVVGLGLVPIIGDNSYDNAIVLAAPELDALPVDDVRSVLLIRVDDGVDVEAVARALEAEDLGPSAVSPPGEQLNLRSALSYPRAVGAMVAALALAGLASALISGANGRRAELAVLRAMGFTPAQVRSSTKWQAAAVSAVGLVVGVPLGWLVGRTAWVAFARTLSLETSFTAPWSALTALVVGALLVAMVLAVPIGWLAARRSLAADLRVG